MDFNFEHFLNVENAISAIFNGFPVVPMQDERYKPGAEVNPAVAQGQLTTFVSSSLFASTAVSKPTTMTFSSNTTTSSNPTTTAPVPRSKSASRGGVRSPSSMRKRSVAKSTTSSKSASSPASTASSMSPPPPSASTTVRSEPSRSPPSSERIENTEERAKTEPLTDPDPLDGLVIPPDLDMSSAIALSQQIITKGKRTHELAFGSDQNFGSGFFGGLGGYGDNGPRNFMTLEEAREIPPNPLRDELVRLYFDCFHPFCPVVDEYEFMRIYDKIGDDEEQIKKTIPLPLFQAMMFVAMSHIPASRLRTTQYQSIHEGQRAFFDKASLLYRMNFTADLLCLTKVALLLTFWSPFDAEYKVNSYWVDRAFNHARALKLWEPQKGDAANRHRIVWWCCLLRDRLISFALRRNYRIQEAKSTWPLVEVSDFGLEVMFPRFIDVKTKRAVIDGFIWLCKLSDIIRDVAMFHEDNSFGREWSDTKIERKDIVPEITQVTQFDNRLKNWREGYLKINGEFIKSLIPRLTKMPNYVLIINDSVVATLYLPYIHCPEGSVQVVQRFQKFALGRIKSASSLVALHIRKLNATANIGEEIIVGIIAWIALPMAVFKVLSEIDTNLPQEPNTGCFMDFVPFLSSLAARFNAAKVLFDMMSEETGEIVDRSFKLGITRKDGQLRVPGNSPKSDEAEEDRRAKEAAEAEVLNVVAKMVDLRLSTDGSK